MNEIAITIKPTLACNMRCLHCFNGENLNSSNIIDVNKVILLLEKASREYDIIKVTFHGGEPTLAGISFYREVFDHQNKMNKLYGVVFRNFLTTNGLLLDEEFVDLLIQNDVLINLSYDASYNFILRQNGDRVLENIKMIQKKKGRIRCFCTLSKSSFSHLLEIYEWFKINNLDFKTLPIEKAGNAKYNDDLIMEPINIAKEFIKVYKIWAKDKECAIRYYTFEEFASLRRKEQFKQYWFNRKIALNPDGNIFPFGRPNDVKYCLGSPEEIDKIDDCFNSLQYIELRKVLNKFYETKCQNCISLDVCNGVAISMSYMYEEDEDLLDYSCNQASIIFQSILSVNENIINDFRNGHTEDYNDTIKTKFSEFLR